tara:strand:+ start:850 stop:1659 length:810 start_codon:yes stop_codon:yes gene_type:complete
MASKMKLSVSNLAWPVSENDWCLSTLSNNGISGVEIAPLKVFNSWESITTNDISKSKEKFASYGLEVSSFQAITFGTEGLALLGATDAKKRFYKHLEKVAWLLAEFETKIAVFGSPALRKQSSFNSGELEEIFMSINEVFARQNVTLAWETVPSYYGCNVLNTLKTSNEFLSNPLLTNICRHFDTGCQYLSGDLNDNQFIKFLSKSKHLHVSEVDLADFSEPSKYNLEIADTVSQIYHGEWCVLEMGDKNFERSRFSSSIDNFARLFSI